MVSISCCGMLVLLMSVFRLLKPHLRKEYFAASFSHTAEEWCLERLLSSAFLYPPHPSFLIRKIKMQPPVKPFSQSASARCLVFLQV